MRVFLDTSVLVAAFSDHQLHHARSLQLFALQTPAAACCGAHSLAEIYSTLTRMPGQSRVLPKQALTVIESIRKQLSVVALTEAEYFAAITSMAAMNIQGGTVYDFILASCALKADADVIYTWNTRHYSLCGAEIRARLRTP